jgi:hypothetical protein
MIALTRVVLAPILLASGLFAACGALGGDKGLPIAFTNRTTETMILYEKGRSNPSYRKELAPDARAENVWVDSRLDETGKDSVKYRVEATTISGDIVFCHEYSFNELTRVRWLVEIRRENDCVP